MRQAGRQHRRSGALRVQAEKLVKKPA